MAGSKKNAASENQSIADMEGKPADLTVGNVDDSALAKLGLTVVDPLKGLDATYNAGQEGFDAGTTKFGKFKGTKRCITLRSKKPRWKLVEGEKEGPAARVYRKLHIFQVVKTDGELLPVFFGLWQAGMLTAALDSIKPNQLLAVTYLGQDTKPLKTGDTPPHLFRIQGKDIDVQLKDLADIESDIEDNIEGDASAGFATQGDRQGQTIQSA